MAGRALFRTLPVSNRKINKDRRDDRSFAKVRTFKYILRRTLSLGIQSIGQRSRRKKKLNQYGGNNEFLLRLSSCLN